ncbi:MAG: N-acetylmuramoyl-L-alanine amidase [Spirochaetia bacterium]
MVKRWCFFLILLTVFSLVLSGQELSLQEIVHTMALDFQWDPYRRIGTLQREDRVIAFRPGFPFAVINGEQVIALPGVAYSEDTLQFSENAFASLASALLPQERDGYFPRVAIIMIDPGHGGRDPGATVSHVIDGETVEIAEKDLVLDVSLRLRDLLSAQYPDKRIVLTRDDDTYPTLEERVEMANDIDLEEHEAIVYLSIHANASLNTSASGYEVWYLPPDYRRDVLGPDAQQEHGDIAPILNSMLEEEYTIESIMLAQEILTGFDQQVGALTESRGLKEESWYVVRNARMPAVLVELGFITNENEAGLFLENEYLNNLAVGMYNGIKNFIDFFENTRGFTE